VTISLDIEKFILTQTLLLVLLTFQPMNQLIGN